MNHCLGYKDKFPNALEISMIAIRNFFLFLLIQFWKLNGVKIEIDTQIKIDELFKFWDSTGFW